MSLWVTACYLPRVSSSMVQPWWDTGTCSSCLLQDVPGIPISKASPFLTCVPKMFSKSYAASFQPTMEVLALAKATSWIYSLKPSVLSSLAEDSALLLLSQMGDTTERMQQVCWVGRMGALSFTVVDNPHL